MNLYIKIIKEIKNFFFLLNFFNLRILYKYLNHKILILLNAKNYNKNYLDSDNLDFSNKWFKYNLLDWLYIFDKKINIKKEEKINILEIGSYEGQSTFFFLKYFKFSTIDCVDTWEGSDEHDKDTFLKVEKKFDKNTSFYFNQVIKNKKKFKDFFIKNKKKYNIIYIDGSHYYKDVYRDAIFAKKNLDRNGIIIFDDYLFNFYKNKKQNPITAINKFLKKFDNEFEIITVFRQVFLRKT